MLRCHHLCLDRLTFLKGRISFFSIFNRMYTYDTDHARDNIRPRRAIMYVPGNDRKKIEKIRSINVDCAVLESEDGVASNMKSEARRVISEISKTYDFGRTEIAVRINSVESGLAEDDLAAILKCARIPETLMVPKVESVNHVKWIDNALKLYLKTSDSKKKINVVFFIESAKSLLDVRQICEKAVELSCEGLFHFSGLVFGSDDFCADIGATRTKNAMEVLTARQMIILVAKLFRVQAIDMVHIDYKDLDSLLQASEEAAAMGYTGKQVIHPSQVPIVQKAFSPTPEKIEWARQLMKLFDQHQREGKGAFTFRGAMIDRPLLLQAENILKLSETLADND